MPEAFDRGEGSEEPDEESLESIREEFLEKYERGEGTERQSLDDEPEKEDAQESGADVASEREVGREEGGDESTRPQEGDAARPKDDASLQAGQESEPVPADRESAEVPDAELEGYREEVLAKYDQSEEAPVEASEPEAQSREEEQSEPAESEVVKEEPGQYEAPRRDPETPSTGRVGDDPGENLDRFDDANARSEDGPDPLRGAVAEQEYSAAISYDEASTENPVLTKTDSIEWTEGGTSAQTVGDSEQAEPAGRDAPREAIPEAPVEAEAAEKPAPPDVPIEFPERPRSPEENEGQETERLPPEAWTLNPGLDSVTVMETAAPEPSQVEARAEATSDAFAEGEPRSFEAVDYGKGVVERFPKTDLEEKGFDPDESQNGAVVELKLQSLQDHDEPPETVFAKYSQSDRRAEAHVGGIGAKEGDRHELLEAREYTEERFVKDFERNKCEHLENVKLEREDDRLFVEVDGRRVELEEHRLSTAGHEAVLSGKLAGAADFEVDFDGRRESARLGRGYLVEGMKVRDDELVVSYEQSRNERHDHRIYLEPEWPSDSGLSLGQFDKPEALERVRMLDAPQETEGPYLFAVDRTLQKSVSDVLDRASLESPNRYAMVKGEIGERLGANLLTLAGWEVVEHHPFNETKKDGANANRADVLLRDPEGELALAEVKWWQNVRQAELRAAAQVVEDLRDNALVGERKVVGAYIVIIDWEINDKPIRILVKRVRPEASF